MVAIQVYRVNGANCQRYILLAHCFHDATHIYAAMVLKGLIN